MRRVARPIALLLIVCGAVGMTPAATVAIEAERDNTLYGESPGFSNGSGARIFAGKNGSFHTRRALMAFDVAGVLPAGSTVLEASLTLHVSQTPNVPTLDCHVFRLYRLLASWGEGDSDAFGPEGPGTEAAPDDATWSHRFFDTLTWTTSGGDFHPDESAELDIGAGGFWEWESGPALVADVQSWLDTPASNHGWILIGDEFDLQTARRFDSRNHPDPSVRPTLTVEYDPPAASAGAVPDGDDVPGVPLTLGKPGPGGLRLSWGASCRATDVDYEIYEGEIGAFSEHGLVTCSTAGATEADVAPAVTSSYYLVVPTDGSVEGSYGRDSAGVERAPAVTSCLAQLMASPVCP